MGTIVLVTWGSQEIPLKFAGISSLPVLALRQEVKVNILDGKMAKINRIGVITLPLIQNENVLPIVLL